MSITCYIYELNNFMAFVNTTNDPQEFHGLMEFIKDCKLSYAMLEAPTIYCEVMEEIRSVFMYDSGNNTLVFKGNIHVINTDVLTACFKLPENNCVSVPTAS